MKPDSGASGSIADNAALNRSARPRPPLPAETLHDSEGNIHRKFQGAPSPEDDTSRLELADLLDAGGIQSLMDEFHKLVPVPMAIIDLQGRVLVGEGWQDICTQFHRVNPETCRNCIDSDLLLTKDVPPGEFKLYKCKNNLWDISTPLMIGGQHVGNVFMGQFFLDDEQIDGDLFRSQARRYGFDEKAYMAALDRVPRLSRETVNTGMRFFLKFARMISQMSYGSIQLARLVAQREALAASLKQSEEGLNRAQELAHLGSWELDVVNNRLSWSDEVYRIFGLRPQEFGATYEAFLAAVHPDDRAAVDAAYSASVREGRDSYEVEHRVIRKATGEVRVVRERCRHFRDATGSTFRSVGMVHDITDQKKKEAELRKLNRALRAIGNSSQAMMHANDEATYLKEVCRIVNEDCGHAMVWIGYAEEDEARTVRPVASSGFEAGYIESLKLSWADTERGRGPTGTAIRTGRPAGCRNMLADPAFAPWREEAAKRGYASSLVLPLLDGHKAFGAISIYAREPEAFSEDETRLLSELAGDLSHGIVALRLRAARARVEDEVRQSEGRLRSLYAAMDEGMALHEIVRDAAGRALDYRILDVNPAFERITGISRGQAVGALASVLYRTGEPPYLDRYVEVAETGQPASFETHFAPMGMSFRISAFSPARDRFATVFEDITERKRREETRRLTAEALQILNSPGEMATQIEELLGLIRRWGGYYAIGLRLRSGEDFPYYFQSGFSDEFVRAENTLCVRNRDGAIARDAAGQPVVECTCGLVLTGRTDPSKPFFTEGGSFWTNEASRLLELKPAEDPRTNPRNRCITDGHESVALIPLKAGQEIIGLLQINDRRKGRFTPETIRFFEELNHSISIALGRKRAEEDLRQYRDQLEELVRERTAELKKSSDALPAYVVLLTTDYRVPFANRFFEERFGKSGGRRCYDYLFKRSEPCENCETFKVLKTGQPHHWEWLGPDGCNYDVHDFPFRDADGAPLILEMGLDVTERKRAEAELKKATEQLFQAQKMEAVGRLAGGVAHDFNNLMTVVSGYSRRVLRDPALDEAHRSAVEQMAKAGERAVSLTRQLLAFSRKQVIHPVALDLNASVDEMRKMLSTVLGEDISVALELEPRPWAVLADPTQITQVIMNLSTNARDAMPTGGCLTIRTANVEIPAAGGGVHEDVPPGRYALLAISDTGTGMSEETRGHLFEPFFTTKGVGEGTGLGLSSVYGIVQQSGGHIRVDTGPGRGTAFRIYLPATEAGGGSADPSPDGQEASAPRGAETILLLEDERAICDLLAAELQDLGYRVLPCQTVGQAIGATEEHEKPIDLLLTDVVLPGMSGPTLARTLRERGKVRQVMFMSGHTEKHIVQHGVLKDGVAFIGKPFTTEALARKIRELLDGKTARQRPPGTGDRAGR